MIQSHSFAATADGCELEFVHHAVDRGMVGDLGPGWEYYLDNLVASRGDGPLPKFDTYYPAQKPYFLGLT